MVSSSVNLFNSILFYGIVYKTRLVGFSEVAIYVLQMLFRVIHGFACISRWEGEKEQRSAAGGNAVLK